MTSRAKKKQRIPHNPTKVKLILDSWGRQGSKNGEFNSPSCIARGTNDILYVTDSDNHRIQCFDLEGHFIRKWGRYGQEKNGTFDFPIGIAVDTCDQINDSLLIRMREVTALAAFPPGLLPICAAYVATEHVYVVDTYNHRIQVFESEGHFIRKWGSRGAKDGQFHIPYGCCMDSSGIFYVADTGNSRLQAFDRNGRFTRKWNNISKPSDVSVSAKGVLYLTSEEAIFTIDTHSDSFSNCSTPAGMSVYNVMVYDEDTLFCCCAPHGSYKSYICQVRRDGTIIKQWFNIVSTDNFAGMEKANHGHLYMVDTEKNRIIVVNIDGGSRPTRSPL